MCGRHHERPIELVRREAPDTRVGDADRDRTADLLRAHAAEGFLDVPELEARLERAYAAKTVADLRALTADLPRRNAAQGAAHARREFREHLRSYLLVMALLVGIWAATDPGGYFWPIWPMLGWGIGVASHGAAARAAAQRPRLPQASARA